MVQSTKFSLDIYKFVKRFERYKSDMSEIIMHIVQTLEILTNILVNKKKFTEALDLFLPQIFLNYVSGNDISATVKHFFDWQHKAIANGDKHVHELIFLEDLEKLEFPMSVELKCDIIKFEIGYYRRYSKYNNTRRILLDKLEVTRHSRFTIDAIVVRIEKIWLGYFDGLNNEAQLLLDCKHIMTDLDTISTAKITVYKAFVSTWIFLLKRKALEQEIVTTDQEKVQKEKSPSMNPHTNDDEENRCVDHLVSLNKDHDMLMDLKDAFNNFTKAHSQGDSTNEAVDAYLSKRVILDSISVITEGFHLMGYFKGYKESLDLLVQFSDKYGCPESKVKAMCDLLSHGFSCSLEIKEAIQCARISNKR